MTEDGLKNKRSENRRCSHAACMHPRSDYLRPTAGTGTKRYGAIEARLPSFGVVELLPLSGPKIANARGFLFTVRSLLQCCFCCHLPHYFFLSAESSAPAFFQNGRCADRRFVYCQCPNGPHGTFGVTVLLLR